MLNAVLVLYLVVVVVHVCFGAGPLPPPSNLAATIRADVCQRVVSSLASLSAVSGLSGLPVLPSVLPSVSVLPASTCFFVPGYRLDASYYRTLEREVSAAPFRFLEGPEYTSSTSPSPHSLKSAAVLMADEVISHSSKEKVVMMMGHSRGAAVAALASLEVLEKEHSSPVRLILLDPVDDSELTAINSLKESSGFLERQRDRLSVYVMSLNYGGYSSYYKKQLASSCAPPGRNADSFIEAFPASVKVTRAVFSDVGHMQILDGSGDDDEEASKGVYSSVCPRSENGDARAAEARRQVRDWVLLRD